MILTGLAVVAYLLLSGGTARADGRSPASPLAAVTGSGHPVRAVVHTAGTTVREATPARTAMNPVRHAARTPGKPAHRATPVRAPGKPAHRATPVRTTDSSVRRATPVRTATETVRKTVRRAAPVVRERTVRSAVSRHDGGPVRKIRKTAPVRSTVDRLAGERVHRVTRPVLRKTEPLRTTVKPVVERIVRPVTERVLRPVTERVVRPVVGTAVDGVVRPAVARVVRPAADAVVQPAVDVVLRPLARTVVEPAVTTVARPAPVPVPVLRPVTATMPPAIAAPAVRPPTAPAARAFHPGTSEMPVGPAPARITRAPATTPAVATEKQPPTCDVGGAAGMPQARSGPRGDRTEEPGRIPAPPGGPGSPTPAMSPVSAGGGPQGGASGWATTSSVWRPVLRPAGVLTRASQGGHGRRLTLALPPG